MWQRIRGIHPGYVITAFFLLLIAANVTFFAIAASLDTEVMPSRAATGTLHSPPSTPGQTPPGGSIR